MVPNGFALILTGAFTRRPRETPGTVPARLRAGHPSPPATGKGGPGDRSAGPPAWANNQGCNPGLYWCGRCGIAGHQAATCVTDLDWLEVAS